MRQLLRPHACVGGELPNRVPWLSQFLNHVLSALEYLHEQRMVHQDIKPDNILFDHRDGTGQPSFYLADFGLSVLQDKAARSQAGTLFYMAPEVGSGEAPTTAVDIWSFAMTLGRVLEFWCEAENEKTAAEWDTKLAALGSTARYVELEPPATGEEDKTRMIRDRWHWRLSSLVSRCLLPPMFPRMLTLHPDRASATECRNASEKDFTMRLSTDPDVTMSDGTPRLS